MSQDAIHAVVAGLSEIIRSELAALSDEHWNPKLTPDQSYDELAFRRKRLVFLRKVRDDFEDRMFGMGRDEA